MALMMPPGGSPTGSTPLEKDWTSQQVTGLIQRAVEKASAANMDKTSGIS
jgi:hypothetical protein